MQNAKSMMICSAIIGGMSDRSPRIADAEDFLRERGAADIAHTGGTLMDHLRRVVDLLDEWGASVEGQLAGLCHASYSTDGFAVNLIEIAERSRLLDVIGLEAEASVYLYASCDRGYTYPLLGTFPVEFRDRFSGELSWPDLRAVDIFMEISAANELDVMTHNRELALKYADSLGRLFMRGHDHLTPPAQEAWSSLTISVDPR